jgi:hypothetical protein
MLNGVDTNTTKPQTLVKPAYVNFSSNVAGTEVYLSGVYLGKTPIKRYQVTPNQDYYLYAFANKKFFEDDIAKTINIKVTTIPTVHLDFQRAKAKIFLVGEDGDLYINDKFEKVLHARNRVFEVEADTNMKFKIRNGYKEVVFYKDIYANSFNEIPYKLITIPLDIRLYTQTIDNEMWEDTKTAANTPIEWEKGKKYCENLRIGEFEDWHMPTIAQLDNLHKKHKDEIYNGFGGVFYWSSNTQSGRNNIWQYSQVLNTDDGEITKAIQEFEDGRIRCVRIINKNLPIPQFVLEDNETIEPMDSNITQNLERFLLK